MALIIAVIAVLVLGVSALLQGIHSGTQIYVSSETPEQGDTVLVRVNGAYLAASGSFNGKSIAFFRNGNSDWYAFLGIDADMNPGEYKILVSVPGRAMEKQISVQAKDFPFVKMNVPKELLDKGFTSQVVADNIARDNSMVLDEILEKFTPRSYISGPFSFPLRKVEQSGFCFGQWVRSGGYDMRHFGADLKVDVGTGVYAVNDGKVVLAKNLSNYGKTMVIDHGLGMFSLYLHLDTFIAKQGEDVANGQIIGESGESGYAAGPHLHFSIKNNMARVDPMLFIEASAGVRGGSYFAGIKNAFFGSLLGILNSVL